jgi:16S rRNA (cytosine967-C5)-methyltransferase
VVNDENPREIAVRVLVQRARAGQYVENLLEKALAAEALSPPDRALCQEIVYGLVRWERTLDWLVARKTDGRAQNSTIRLLLHLGLYQIFWLQRIPDHAAVHETVELGKRLGFDSRAGFLNAVLRGFIRENAATRDMLEALKTSDPALGYSHPAWLVENWRSRWGVEKTRPLLEWNNTAPPLFARRNSLRADQATLAARWAEEGIQFQERQWDWTGTGLVFELRSHPPLAHCRSFQDGLFYIQDPSTLLAVEQLAPQPGESVLDWCAAPGGKTTFMAQLMRNRGTVVAQDNQPERLQLLRENCQRAGADCVQVSLSPPPPGEFDRILIDAPCSNTGVLRRRVDLRWRLQPAEIQRLRRAQKELLAQAASKLKPRGTLVYSTCSLEPEENEEVVREFLQEQPGFALENERQLLPFVDGVDGAYVAKLRRKAPEGGASTSL